MDDSPADVERLCNYCTTKITTGIYHVMFEVEPPPCPTCGRTVWHVVTHRSVETPS